LTASVEAAGTRRRRVRRGLLIAVVAALVLVAFFRLGTFLVHVDPLTQADAAYVLGGSRVDRALEALELYRQGHVPRIVMSNAAREAGEILLDRQGVHVPTDAEIVRDTLIGRLGVPADAVILIPDNVDNTAAEADLIKPYVARGGWHRLMVITGCATTRRAGFAFHRVFGSSLAITVRCSRYDSYRPSRWWASRSDLRTTMTEFPKLVAYWLGLKG
jgi:uncharacterized SAM-binding protein YcdF (DUF218 family)